MLAQSNQLTNLNLDSYLQPWTTNFIYIATIVATLLFVIAGLVYMTSAGKAANISTAKNLIKTTTIGLILIITATALVGFLTSSWNSSSQIQTTNWSIPETEPKILEESDPDEKESLLVVVTKFGTDLIDDLVETIGKPAVNLIDYFVGETQSMKDNSAVVETWSLVATVANSLLILFIVGIGFKIMLAPVFDWQEVRLRSVLPKIFLVFLLLVSSLTIIDTLIELNNAIIASLNINQTPASTLWSSLIATDNFGINLGIILIRLIFIILTVWLVVYYLMRLVFLMVGAVLSPLIIILSLTETFSSFCQQLMVKYFFNIFIVVGHNIILILAANLFWQLPTDDNQLLGLSLGLATLISLLKLPGVIKQMAVVSSLNKNIKIATGKAQTMSTSTWRQISNINTNFKYRQSAK